VSLLSPAPAEKELPFRVRLRRIAEEAQRKRPHPVEDRIAQVRGTIGPDGVERISSQQLANVLALEPKERTPATWRTIAAAMAQHGWTPVRYRDVGRSGHREQLRGFARPARD
jgi:hypothetical protein